MSARSGDWQLLGHDSDPVPGDSSQIADAGEHYSSIATTISGQVQRLRQLEADDEILKGEYADGLRESCGALADDLDRVHDRFEQVGSELSSWWEPVQTARTKTATALLAAEDAQSAIDANPEPETPILGAPEPTSVEKDDAEAQGNRHGNAVDALDQARTDFDSAMNTYNDLAEDVANAIRKASDDDMKDSRWDSFKGWVDDNAGWLTTVAEVISWVVVAVAIIALFVTPVGWVLAIVAVAALIGLGIRFALAASGNGSWADFAIDLVGVLTLGTGKIATGLAKIGRAATLRAIGTSAGRLAQTRTIAAARQAFADAPFLSKPVVWLARSNPIFRWLSGRAAFTSTKRVWTSKLLPKTTPMERIAVGGDETTAAMTKELEMLRTLFPEFISNTYTRGVAVATGAARTGAVVDVTDKLLGDNPLSDGLPAYMDAKDHFTYAPGGHLG